LTGFTKIEPVVNAWEVVLGLTNMFFVIILLVIAFGTVLNIEAYSWKKLLPTFVLVAILVNFSKTICGLAIDASQIIMLSFVNALGAAHTQNFVTLFRLDKLLALKKYAGKANNSDIMSSVVIATFASGIMLTVITMVLLVFCVVLLGRLAVLWIATILSPIAFACAILPASKKYYQQWMETFTRYLIVGPLIMFFLWLALYIASSSYATSEGEQGIVGQILREFGETETKKELQKVAEESGGEMASALEVGTIANLIIAVMLLMKGLEFAESMASEFGQFMGKAKGWGKGIGLFAGGLVGGWALSKLGKAIPAVAKKAVVGTAKTAANYGYQATGIDVNLKRVWEKMMSERAAIAKERELAGRAKAAKWAESGSPLAWLGASDYAYRQYTPILGEQKWSLFKKAGGQDSRAKEAKESLKALTDDKSDIEEKRAAAENKFNETYTNEEQSKQDSLKAAKLGVIQASVTGEMDSSDATTREMLSGFLASLKEDKRDAEAEQIQNILDGKQRNLRGDLGKEFEQGYLGKQIGDLRSSKKKLGDTEYEAQYKKDVGKYDDQIAANKKETEAQKKKYRENFRVRDYGGVQAMRSYMDEELKNIQTDNEDDLRALLQSKIKAGDQSGVLAVILQSAKVGHMNEMCDELGYEETAEGMRQMWKEKLIASKGKGGMGIDQELAMSVADEASRAAKATNHWNFAEMVKVDNGQFVWRSQQEQQMRCINEMEKAGINNILRVGNRLAMGGHYKDADGNKKWRFNESGLLAVGKSLGKGLSDMLGKNMVNRHWVQNLMENPEEIAKLERVMKEQAKARPDKAGEIEKSFRDLLQYVSKTGAGTGYDPNKMIVEVAHITGRTLSNKTGYQEGGGAVIPRRAA
ncbi:MAG: hypothetical protein ABID45_01750, partial [Patescibacteria group bacterium]